MWSIAAILLVGMFMTVIEMPSLIRRKKRKEIWAFSVLLLAGIALNIAVVTGIQVPSPLEWIRDIFDPSGKAT